ncbi:MAG: hypothetical protein HY011_18950 [Acidobacteria bacterium]|nr:hypothetical protein [Acidobacteriota bacterium]
MTPTFEQVLQTVQALPLADKIKLGEWLARETAQDGVETRRALVMQTMGSMAGLLPSTEKLLAERHAELATEEGAQRW